MGLITRVSHHPAFANPAISLGLTAFSLLLLVLVLLSVPGPIKGLYWFSIQAEQSGVGDMTVGVLGWCLTQTINCTYAPLSENKYLSTMIDSGQALTVRIMLPLACYWSILTLITWVLLSGTVKLGYLIKNLDSIRRHLYFAVLEASVLCITLFGNVLCWLAFGLGRGAYMTVKRGGGMPKSGQAMEVAAVAALISLFSLFTAIWGLHLRLSSAQSAWKKEAIMVRRRSRALSASGIPHDSMGNPLPPSHDHSTLGGGGGGGSTTLAGSDANGTFREKRWSDATFGGYAEPKLTAQGQAGKRSSILKDSVSLNGGISNGVGADVERGSMDFDEEERLDAELATARRNSRDHATLQRASIISPNDSPYAVANAQPQVPARPRT